MIIQAEKIQWQLFLWSHIKKKNKRDRKNKIKTQDLEKPNWIQCTNNNKTQNQLSDLVNIKIEVSDTKNKYGFQCRQGRTQEDASIPIKRTMFSGNLIKMRYVNTNSFKEEARQYVMVLCISIASQSRT